MREASARGAKRLLARTHARIARSQQGYGSALGLLLGVLLAEAGLLVAAFLLERGILPGLLLAQASYIFVGRETSILLALGREPAPQVLPLMAAVALVDLFLISGAWLLFQRWLHWLHHRSAGVRILGPLERGVLRYRSTLDRWGLPFLVVFVWFPAVGTGVVAAVLLGVLARLPAASLLAVVSVAGVAADAFWTYSLSQAVAEWLPDRNVATIIGWSMFGLIIGIGTFRMWWEMRQGIVPLGSAGPVEARLRELSSSGIRAEKGVVIADCAALAKAADLNGGGAAACRSLGQFLLVPGMDLQRAQALQAAGLATVEDLAHAPERSLATVLETRGGGLDDLATLQEEARKLVAAGL